jgi:hypothetical protein
MASTQRKKTKQHRSPIKGHLDIFTYESVEDFEGTIEKWQTVMIHGDPEGLRCLAQLLLKIANANQEEMKELPIGAREHVHLSPNVDISKSSAQVIVGRMDAKGSGEFYERYVPIERAD